LGSVNAGGLVSVVTVTPRKILSALALWAVLAVPGCAGPDGRPDKTRDNFSARPAPAPLCLPGSANPGIIAVGLPESISGVDEYGTSSLPGLAAWLSQRIGRPLSFVSIRNYNEFTEGLQNGRLQAALIPPAEFIRARKVMPCLTLVASTVYGTSVFYDADLIVHRDSSIRSVKGLRGKRIAFSSPRSASGYIYAARFLAGKGMVPWRDYEPVFTGSHRETIIAVQQKTVDAGATFTDALRIAGTGDADLSSIAILAVAGRIASEPLVVSADLAPELSRRIGNAFLELDLSTPEERAILGAHDLMAGWIETDESVYLSIGEVMNEVDSLNVGEVEE